jgi:hypothetical protein
MNAQTFSDQTLRKAGEHLTDHKEELQNSAGLGCCSCTRCFFFYDVLEWATRRGKHTTALCPHCKADGVIGDASGYPLTEEFLNAMQQYWFTSPVQQDILRGKPQQEAVKA